MKKLLTLALCCLIYSAKGQTKIGSITVSDNIAIKYLHDCYQHPDTLFERSENFYLCRNCSVPQSQITDAESRAKEYNADLRRSAIKIIQCECIISGSSNEYLVPRKPSETDFIKWLVKNKQ